jgi:hypothetical protein
MSISRQDIFSQALGLRYAARFEKTSGASNRFVFINMSEGALSCVGKQVTLSFWIRKGPSLTSGVAVSVGTRAAKYGTVYNSGDFGILNSQINSSTFTRFTSTFNITSATANAGADLFELEFSAVQAGGTGVYFDIAGVQLEVGNIPTPFSRAGGTIAGELASCQRYYERITGSPYTPMGVGQCGSTTASRISVPFKVTKRVSPGFSSSALSGLTVWGASFNGLTPTALYALAGGRDIMILQAEVSSGLVAGNATQLLANDSSSAFIEFSAEL